MIPESNLSSGGCTLKTAERPIHTPRPLLTMGVSPDSGSNVPVTCRSTRSHVERQLLHPTSSHNRPFAVLRGSGGYVSIRVKAEMQVQTLLSSDDRFQYNDDRICDFG